MSEFECDAQCSTRLSASSFLARSGPRVTVLHLLANGNVATPVLDMTPRVDAVAGLLGGGATFVGQYGAPLNAAIMCLKDQTDQAGPINKHVLAKPYDRDAGTLRGGMQKRHGRGGDTRIHRCMCSACISHTMRALIGFSLLPLICRLPIIV
jgi:hypothetical protein